MCRPCKLLFGFLALPYQSNPNRFHAILKNGGICHTTGRLLVDMGAWEVRQEYSAWLMDQRVDFLDNMDFPGINFASLFLSLVLAHGGLACLKERYVPSSLT